MEPNIFSWDVVSLLCAITKTKLSISAEHHQFTLSQMFNELGQVLLLDQLLWYQEAKLALVLFQKMN